MKICPPDFMTTASKRFWMDPTRRRQRSLLYYQSLSSFSQFLSWGHLYFHTFSYFTLDHSPNILYRPDISGFRGLGAVFKLETKGVSCVRNSLQSGFSFVDGGCIILKNRISLWIYSRTAGHTFSFIISQYILLFKLFWLPSYSIHRSDTKIGLFFGIKPL